MSLGYGSRLSQGGLGRADPVLSSFSPVGASRAAKDGIVAQIQPRTSMPLQSSAISRSMVSAEGGGERGGGPDAMGDVERTGGTLGWSSGRDSLTTELVARRDKGYVVSSLDRPAGAESGEGLGRLSISGRLSVPSGLGAREVGLSGGGLTTAAEARESGTKVNAEGVNINAESVNVHANASANAHAHAHTHAHARTNTAVKPEYRWDRFAAGEKTAADPRGPLEDHRQSSAGRDPLDSMLQVVRGLVERSIGETMAEVRNDIQNLHVELIKQSLAQQNALHQIVANMPDMYKKLAEDYRNLQEDNERLKLRLSIEGKL